MNRLVTNLEIKGLSQDGRGVTHIDGKTCFVKDAIPGDTVDVQVFNDEQNFVEAKLTNITQASNDRVTPFCQHYNECGGCQLQHLSIEAQRHWKTQNFFTQTKQKLNTESCEFVDTLTSNDKGYRRRAKLALEIDKKDKQPRLGFRKPQDSRLVDIQHCPILCEELNQALTHQRPKLIEQASRRTKEFTLVAADNGVFGFTNPTTEPNYQIQQTPKSITIEFPRDGFIQVNQDINQQMIEQAIDWLDVNKEHQVIDFFCGVGNFTLALAQHCKSVLGVEGLDSLINYAQKNAQSNQLSNCLFVKADLFEDLEHFEWFRLNKYDRILLDPGRLGAAQLCHKLKSLGAQKIVYVSCNASTLIRDIKILEKQGYRLKKAGLLDQFPHTHHTETMVLLEQTKKFKKDKKQRLNAKKKTFRI
jgi:23S rRNA (uracil1939-C5)-methyltransferase